MTGSNKFSTVVAGIGLALLPAALFPAHAAPPAQIAVQILDPSGACASWTWGGTPSAPTVTCEPAAPPTPGVPSGCSLAANPSTLPAGGGQVALTATCTNGTDSATLWAWSGSGAVATGPGPSPQTQRVNVSATTTFGVIATNSVGPSANKTATVTVGAPPPPPPSGSIQCSGFAKTIVIDIPWTATTVTTSGFDGSTVSFKFNIGGVQELFKVQVQPGQTYFMNLRNTGTNGLSSCPGGQTCEAYISFNKPKGT